MCVAFKNLAIFAAEKYQIMWDEKCHTDSTMMTIVKEYMTSANGKPGVVRGYYILTYVSYVVT